MMEVRKPLQEWLRSNRSQGYFECASVLLFFSFAIYEHFGDPAPLLTLLLAIPLMALNLFDAPDLPYSLVGIVLRFAHRYYWAAVVPLTVVAGAYCCNPLFYAGIQAALYFQMIKGVDKVFTAGEHLLNSYVVINILRFSLESYSVECSVMYYSVSFRIHDS